jgi:hypothetical protein
MAGEMKVTYATQFELEGSGATAGSTAFVAADDHSMGSADHSNYPMADFVLTCAFGGGVTAGLYVNLYRQDLLIDGASNAPAPGTAFKFGWVGTFNIPSGNSLSQAYPCNDVPLSANCQFYIENGTNQTISAAWTLRATPKSFVPGT